MRAVVQRVQDCSVAVDDRIVGRIEYGLLVYLGVGRGDAQADLSYIADKIINLRIFPDSDGKMNLSVLDIDAAVLLVSQFTLFGDARQGRRPSYVQAAEPEQAGRYYEKLIAMIRASGVRVEKGEFAAMMKVSYTNVGPVTILLDSKKAF